MTERFTVTLVGCAVIGVTSGFFIGGAMHNNRLATIVTLTGTALWACATYRYLELVQRRRRDRAVTLTLTVRTTTFECPRCGMSVIDVVARTHDEWVEWCRTVGCCRELRNA